MNIWCAVILNDYRTGMPLDDVSYCRKPAIVPMKLPSGKIVAWCCDEHRKVASA